MTKAEVDFKAKQATVTFDAQKTTAQKIADGLEKETSGRYSAKVKS